MKKKATKLHHQVRLIDGEVYYKPFSEDAIKKADKYKQNQLIHFNPVGETDQRSVKAIRLYFQACKFICDRVDGENFTTYKKVDIYVRAECDLYDLDNAIKDIRGDYVYAPLLSIAFHNMEHLDSCDFFNEAYGVMCNLMTEYGFDVELFILAVKNSCKGVNHAKST